METLSRTAPRPPEVRFRGIYHYTSLTFSEPKKTFHSNCEVSFFALVEITTLSWKRLDRSMFYKVLQFIFIFHLVVWGFGSEFWVQGLGFCG